MRFESHYERRYFSIKYFLALYIFLYIGYLSLHKSDSVLFCSEPIELFYNINGKRPKILKNRLQDKKKKYFWRSRFSSFGRYAVDFDIKVRKP